jgi:hypothetical protein
VQPKIAVKAADKKGRDKANSYVKKKGELAGIIKLVTGWHAIGQKVRALWV